ncbi:MAG TPA: DUF2272 domain-containing protein [Candidatus Sulfomarinibacteraceae bacterium]|nr:DUF2272 domain-containing protein [Candidatus Sulfomarinibacteraceae bacterium]
MSKNRDYKSYLLRLWRAAGEQWEPWQAMLEDPRSGERVGFASLDALFRYLRSATGGNRGPAQERAVGAPYPMEDIMLLRAGDRGPAVRRVQEALRDEGFDIVVDGIFGPGTEAAVKAFQERRGLVVDGIAGPNTLGALGLTVDGGAPGPGHADAGGARRDPGSNDWTTLKARVVQLANQEWARWHNGGKKTETDPEMTPVLQDYYRTGVGEEIPAGRIQNPTWQANNPWSAVFISWLMRAAGAGSSFRYSRAHQRYIAAAKRNRERNNAGNPFWAFRVDEVAPQVGDLVCAERANSGATYENIDDGFKASHCDIVTEVRPGQLTVIGGNVGDTVGKKTVRTDNKGFIDRNGRQRRFFAVIRIRTE